MYSDGKVFAEAPVSKKEILKGIIVNGDFPKAKDNDIIIITTGGGRESCPADFSFGNVNYANNTVTLTYTGTPLDPAVDDQFDWSIPGQTSTFTNQTVVTVPLPIGNNSICVRYTKTEIVPTTVYYYEMNQITVTGSQGQDSLIDTYIQRSMEVDKKVITCTAQRCKTVNVEECDANFKVTGSGATLTFDPDDCYVPQGGTITSYVWDFGDGSPFVTMTTDAPVQHTYTCTGVRTAKLTISSTTCVGGTDTYSKNVDPTTECCDANPESSWKTEPYPGNVNKEIEYRYDMGVDIILTNWWDQQLKAKLKNYEKNSNNKWKKKKRTLSVSFNNGKVYGNDHNECYCVVPKTVIAEPLSKDAKDHTFKDDLGGFTLGTSKIHRIKLTDPVYITYRVDGNDIFTQETTTSTGFHCEN
jgi:hypothetical protein